MSSIPGAHSSACGTGSRPAVSGEVLGSLVQDDEQHDGELAAFERRLLSNLAHQARSSLAATRGYTRLTLDERAGALNETQKHYLTTAWRNVQGLVDLINVMTGMLETGSSRGMDVSQLVGEAARVSSAKAKEGNVRVDVHLEARPHVLIGDQGRLLEAFLTLITEATRVIPPGGGIRVETRSRNGFVDTTLTLASGALPSALLSELDRQPAGGLRGAAGSLARAEDMVRLHGGSLRAGPATPSNSSRNTLVLSLPVFHPAPRPRPKLDE